MGDDDGGAAPANLARASGLSRDACRFEPWLEIGAGTADIGLAPLAFAHAPLNGRKQAKIDVHGLKGLGLGATGDVMQQRAERGGRRRRSRLLVAPLGGEKGAGEESHCGAFDVTLDAGDLAGETQPRIRLQAQRPASSRRGELRNVLRWMPPSRAKRASSSPGIVRNTRA